jgi:hypothetical protein
VRERLGATIGSGVAIAIVVPVLAILALVTVVGIPFGIALLLAAIPCCWSPTPRPLGSWGGRTAVAAAPAPPAPAS